MDPRMYLLHPHEWLGSPVILIVTSQTFFAIFEVFASQKCESTTSTSEILLNILLVWV